jgi:5-methylcytosine-specific restriction endonuclease McrA
MAAMCKHPSPGLVWVPVGTPGFSTRQLRYQCPDCFEFLGSSQRHTLATPDTPEIDPNTLVLRNERREREREKWSGRWEELRLQQDAEWWSRYNEYLATDEWKELRKLVLARDENLCQGCREHKATQVHHLTYRNAGHEFLWELISVCDECHKRYHDDCP